jgi:hypothetical protein
MRTGATAALTVVVLRRRLGRLRYDRELASPRLFVRGGGAAVVAEELSAPPERHQPAEIRTP